MRRKTDDEYMEEAKPIAKVKGGKVLGVIREKGKNTKIKIQCAEGHIYKQRMDHLRRGCWCSKCAKQGLSDKERKSLSMPYIEAHNGELLKLTRAKGKTRETFKIKCKYGHIFKRTLMELKIGQWCPRCASSYGEKLLAQVFEQNNIWYDREVFQIINGEKHRFDYVVHYNGTNQLVYIEWDGIQHFLTSKNGEGNLYYDPNRQRKDVAKDEWCKQNGFGIVRFNYKDDVKRVLSRMESFCGYYNLKTPDLTIEPSFKQYKKVADYYKNHSAQHTAEKFNVSEATVLNHFRKIYGKSKYNVLLSQNKAKIANYYINHSGKVTAEKFKVDECTVQRYFKEIYGKAKNKYLREHGLKNKNRGVGLKIAVIAIDSFGNEKFFCSRNEASETLGVFTGNISKVLRGKCKTTNGYRFRNATPEEIKVQKPLPQDSKQLQLNLNEVKNIS